MRATSLRVLCAVAARYGLTMRRWDFVSAYLQGSLQEGEVVYCSMPPGHETTGADGRERVCRVEKPIYGMAQAGRRWQRAIYPWLTSPEVGLSQCSSDSSVFTIMETVQTPEGPRDEYLIVGCYVDDLFCLYSHDDEFSVYSRFTTQLEEAWDVDDEGPVADLLNVEISSEGGCVVMRQTGYIERLVKDYLPDGVPNSHQEGSTPCDETIGQAVADALACLDEPDPVLRRRYQSLVGALLYCASNTRPDVGYSVGMLCRAMSRPTPELYASAERVLYYLYRNRHLGLRFERDDLDMHGLSDSNWEVKHSTSGALFTLCRAAISWGSKKQTTVALSSCEAELMAASEAAKEAVYLDAFLGELGVGSGAPVSMGVDNKAAIDLAYNPEHHQKTKHIERRHFYLRELVEDLRITVPFVATADNFSDFFTKPLKPAHFRAMRNVIMNVP